MIKCLITFVSFMFACSLFAQEYNSINSLSRIGIVYYVEDENGFYNKMENVSLQSVRDPITTYAYDKKSQNLYMTTKRGNFVVRLNDAYANYFKRSKSVAFLKENELKEAIQSKNNELEEKYKKLNDERQKQIDASKERARIDSIKKAYNDSVKIVKEKERARIYRNNHDWSWVPTKGKRLFCVLCEKGITTRDSSLCYAIIKDSIYWADIIEGDLGVSYNHIHAAEVSKDLKKNISYAVHMEFYRDSLENIIPIMSKFYAGLKNYISYQDYLEKLKKKAPNGYFLGWNWDKEYSSISFNFRCSVLILVDSFVCYSKLGLHSLFFIPAQVVSL